MQVLIDQGRGREGKGHTLPTTCKLSPTAAVLSVRSLSFSQSTPVLCQRHGISPTTSASSLVGFQMWTFVHQNLIIRLAGCRKLPNWDETGMPGSGPPLTPSSGWNVMREYGGMRCYKVTAQIQPTSRHGYLVDVFSAGQRTHNIASVTSGLLDILTTHECMQ